jgi:hypothetical protein
MFLQRVNGSKTLFGYRRPLSSRRGPQGTKKRFCGVT